LSPSPARRFAALVVLVATPAAALAEGETSASPAAAPKVEVAAIVTGFLPLTKGDASKADLWFASLTGSFERKGFGARAEMRGAPGGFRSYYGTDIWLQEGYAWVATPAGDLRVGKSERAFGLPDETFTGTLFSDNGITRNPFWGASVTGETRIGYDSLTWAVRWEGLGEKTSSWEEEGRGAASDPATKLTDGFSARVGYLVYKGLVTFRPALSGSTVRVAHDDGRAGFRLNDLSIDATATAGPIAFLGQLFFRDGARQTPGAADARLAYDDATAGLVGIRAELPTVTFRYTWSQWRYRGARATEWLHQPAVVWTPRKGIEATIEYLARRITGPDRRRFGDAFRLGLALRF
jgi:hypothetical protein